MTERRGKKRNNGGGPGDVAAEYRRAASRLLARLAEPGLHAERRDDRVVIVRMPNNVSTPTQIPSGVLAELLQSGALRCVTRGGRAQFVITDAGHARVRREADGERNGERDGKGDFGAQHREMATRTITLPDGAQEIRVNLREDPLDLFRRNHHLAHLVGEVEIEAGQRLRRDMHLAGTAPRVTANWSRLVVDGAGYQPGLNETEVIIAARNRTNAALRAVGPDFANVLIDVCAFSKGIEAIEREHALPARSGKVVLGLGLRALARHYGLSGMARGALHQPIRHWGTEDYRPRLATG